MGGSNEQAIERLCSAVVSDAPSEMLTREEALALLDELFSGIELEQRIKRLQIHREPYALHYYQQYRQYFEIFCHNGSVDRICFDNSSEFAFTGAVDGVIKVWNVCKGMLVRSLYGHCAAVNDLCVSPSGRFLISADCQGMISVWCLKQFRAIHTFSTGSEVIFCEFISLAKDQGDVHAFTCVLANGILKTIRFNSATVLSEKENRFMNDENIKAICVTDGGRFVICGGWWPFLLMYDTYTPDSVIVLEEYRTQTLCACKNALKIAASSGDQICVYTFYPEGGGGLGSFRHRKNLPGHWARSVLATGETANVDRMCFLPNFWLVTLSADGVVRIYDDRHEISSFQAELGCIYAHPFLNIFAIVGQRLKMYEVACDGPANTAGCASWRPFSCDARVVFSNTRHTQPPGAVRKIYSGDIPISVNDCEFSADGRFFITGDDRGVIRAYSVCAPIHPPQQQFFPQDLDVSSRQTDTMGTNSPFGMTFDANMNINVNWKAQNYTIRSKRMCLQVELEELAAQHLLKDKLDQNTFYNLYLATEDGPATQSSSSEDDETWDEAMSTEESSTRTESEDILTEESEQMRGLRRVIESSEDEDEPVFNMRQRPLRRTAIRSIVIKGDDSDGGMDSRDKPIEGEEEIRGRPIRQSSVLNSMHNPSSLSNNNPRRRPIRQASVLNGNIDYALEATLGAINDERDTSRDVSESSESSTTNSATATTRSTASTANSTTATKHKIQLRRTVLTESISSESDHGIDPQFEETLLAYAKKWLRSFFVYRNDKIYFCAEAYETFASLERRIFPDGPGLLPATGNHTVTSVEHRKIGRIPYLLLGLSGGHTIRYYEYPNGTGIACRTEQHYIRGNASVLDGDVVLSGRIRQSDGLMVEINGSWFLRSSILVAAEPLPVSQIVYEPRFRILFGRIRNRDDVPQELEYINYDVVNNKIVYRIYKNKNQLLYDLRVIVKHARVLGSEYLNYTKSVLKKVSDELFGT